MAAGSVGLCQPCIRELYHNVCACVCVCEVAPQALFFEIHLDPGTASCFSFTCRAWAVPNSCAVATAPLFCDGLLVTVLLVQVPHKHCNHPLCPHLACFVACGLCKEEHKAFIAF